LFPNGINADNGSIGENISKIYEVRIYLVLQLVHLIGSPNRLSEMGS